jgi:DNA-binding GntR family transcriptional regulator
MVAASVPSPGQAIGFPIWLTIRWTSRSLTVPRSRRKVRVSEDVRAGAAATRKALAALRTAMFDGDLAPGQRLVEGELAELYGISRASVRAALIDLASEGLVERIPNRGARVRVVSVAEAVAITECRMVLEGLCAAKAAEHASDPQIAVLTGLGEQMRDAVAGSDPMKYSALNRELHRLVREYSAQHVASGLLDRLGGQMVRHQFRLALRAGRPQVSLPEHLAIIDAIAARDPAAAEAAARAHLGSVIAALRASDT